MMNPISVPAEHSIPHTSLDSTIISSELQSITELHIQIPLAQLKDKFQEIVLNPKHNLEADYYQAWISRSMSTSATTDNTTTNTLYSDDYTGLYVLLSVEDINALHGIVATLKSTEYLSGCTRIYIDHRKGVVKRIWRRLYQKVNNRDGHNHSVDFADMFNEKLQWWIQVASIFLCHVFMKEKTVYEEIFANTDDYLDIIGETALDLFDFAGKLVSSPQFPKKLEMLLPVYQQVLDQMPKVDILFQKDSSSPLAQNIHAQATGLISRISNHITQILLSCKSQVLEETSMAPPGGKIHSMTECVTSYVESISNYRNYLTDLSKSIEASNGANDSSMEEKDKELFLLRLYVTRIIDSMRHNLKKKSLVYENESLGYIFMMNNVNHVAERIKSSKKMQELIGEDLETKLSETVNQAMSDYVGTSWNKVLECLDIDKSKQSGFSLKRLVSFNPVKNKFETFNQLFDENLQREAEWVVNDQKLRKKLHQLILDKVIPDYTSFLKQNNSHIKKLWHPEKYNKYSVKDLKKKISSLFQSE